MEETGPNPVEAGGGDRSASSLGRAFAEALARKDFDHAAEVLDPDVDFRGLTPNRSWQASSAAEVASEVLPLWFEESDSIDELVGLESEALADRERVAYRFRGHNGDGPFIVEQQAYFAAESGRITWIRVLCSGFRPS